MDTESPRALGKREGRKVHCGGQHGPTPNRPKLQANAAMIARLDLLRWAAARGVTLG